MAVLLILVGLFMVVVSVKLYTADIMTDAEWLMELADSIETWDDEQE